MSLLFVAEFTANFVSENFADAFEITTEAETVVLNVNIAHFGHVLAYDRRLQCKVMNFHLS